MMDFYDDMYVNIKDDVELGELICSHEHVEIFKAKWRKYQEVCVKKINLTKENKSLVEREIDILSKCIHPKICQFLGTGTYNGCVYMLFEYMECGDLQSYIKNNTLTYKEKEQILISVLIGMNYLSSRTPEKILHRDFKPSNILINRHGAVKICDFGVSKQMFNKTNADSIPKSMSCGLIVSHSHDSSDISHTGIGTVRWAAPELLKDTNKVYDERCDIYSFGLLASYIITDGGLPYSEYTNLAQIAYAKTNNCRSFLDNCKIQDNKLMLELITSCTEIVPDDRPKDANSIISFYFKHCIHSS